MRSDKILLWRGTFSAIVLLVISACTIVPREPGTIAGHVDGFRLLYRAQTISIAYAVGDERPISYVSAEKESGVTPASYYAIGSVTKQFTAAIILRLVGTGRLKLSTPIVKYLPLAQVYYPTVTVDDLLVHTSGIPDYLHNCDQCASLDGRASATAMLHKAPDFAVGSAYEYSNTNYQLLGLIAEKVTGRSYPANLQTLAKQLNLGNIYYGSPPGANIATPKRRTLFGNVAVSNPFPASATGAAGAIYSTPSAIATWVQHLYVRRDVLTPSELTAFLCLCRQMQPGSAVGRGVYIVQRDDHLYYQMSGVVPGYTTMTIFSPRDRVTVVAMTNQFDLDMTRLLMQIEPLVAREGRPRPIK